MSNKIVTKLNQDSISPQMNKQFPQKTRFSRIRQYNPKKPTKWDFKNFARSGSSGIMYGFLFYTRATGNEK